MWLWDHTVQVACPEGPGGQMYVAGQYRKYASFNISLIELRSCNNQLELRVVLILLHYSVDGLVVQWLACRIHD